MKRTLVLILTGFILLGTVSSYSMKENPTLSVGQENTILRLIAPFTRFLTQHQKKLIISMVFAVAVSTIGYVYWQKTRPKSKEVSEEKIESLKEEKIESLKQAVQLLNYIIHAIDQLEDKDAWKNKNFSSELKTEYRTVESDDWLVHIFDGSQRGTFSQRADFYFKFFIKQQGKNPELVFEIFSHSYGYIINRFGESFKHQKNSLQNFLKDNILKIEYWPGKNKVRADFIGDDLEKYFLPIKKQKK